MMKTVFSIILFLCLVSCTASGSDLSREYIRLPHEDVFDGSGTSYRGLYFDWVDTTTSTCFEYIGYDYEDEYLCVCFRDSGSVYVYSGVPESVWDNLYEADSRGSAYNRNIKGRFPCERIKR